MKRPYLPFAAACILSVFASSCARAPVNAEGAREPASIRTLGPSATLEDLLRSEDPRAEARAYVAKLLRLQLRAHGWLFETDKLFENAKHSVKLFRHSAYRKLMVARSISEDMEDKILELFMRAHGLTLEDARGAEQQAKQDKALLVVAGIRDAVLHAQNDQAERVLLHNLIRKMRKVAEQQKPGTRPSLVLSPLEAALVDAVAAGAANASIQERLSALPESDEVKEEVDQAESAFADAIEESDREPNALGIFPTAGSSGNIDGFTFPAGTWALTFDDGPHPEITESDLTNLKAGGVKATFFWLAKNLEANSGVVKAALNAGMALGNHSWSHAKLDDPSDLARLRTNLDREINRSTMEDIKYFGQRPKFFRCPYGSGFRNPVIRSMIAKLGMIHVRWNVDSLDWKDPNPASVQARVERQMAVNGRGIILFHDIHTPALTVVPRILAKYKGKARWVTIPQIVDELNGGRR